MNKVFSSLLLSFALALGCAGAQAGDEAAAPTDRYLSLEPDLVVNLSGEDGMPHYLKAGVQLYVRTAADASVVETHMPLIRDRLIHYLGGRDVDVVSDVAQREDLRLSALEMLQRVLLKQVGSVTLAGLYFDDFITQ